MGRRQIKQKTWSVLSKLYLVLVFIFVYAPVAVMVVFSFNNSKTNVSWQGFTLKYYIKLMSDSSLWEVFGTTVMIAVISTIIAVVVGTTGAVGLRNAKFKGKKLISNLIYFPIVLPEIVMAVALLLTFRVPGLSLSKLTIIIGNTTLVLPYVYITVKSRLVGMDPSIEEASLDLGADRLYTFLHVTLPQIVPGVMSGALMSVSLVLNDLIITSFLADAGTTTLPIKVYSMIKKGITPEINALTTIVLAVFLVFLAIYLIYMGIKASKMKRLRAEALARQS